MTKYQEPFDDVNPSFKINLKPYGDLKGIPAQNLIRLLLPQLQKSFKDFAVVQAPTDVLVSGIQSAYIRINYTMELADGRSFPAASELWIVPRGDYFFMIGAGTRQDEKTGTRAEIQGILDSIRITNEAVAAGRMSTPRGIPMRFLKTTMAAGCVLLLAASQPAAALPQAEAPAYDAALARSLGADERGMRPYVFVILKTGPKNIEDKSRVPQALRLGGADDGERRSQQDPEEAVSSHRRVAGLLEQVELPCRTPASLAGG